MEGKDGQTVHPQTGGEDSGDPLDPREVRAQRLVVEPVVQPARDYEAWSFFSIQIEDSLAAYLRALGGGDLSEGVRLATRSHQAATERGQ